MGQSLGCIKVNQSTMAVTEHFGRFDKVLGPGCHCLPGCFGFELAGKLSLRDELISVHCETNTKDNCFVKVVTYIRYRVVPENASDAFYKLSNPRLVMQAYVFDVIRATVPRLELDAVFLQKKGIAKAVEDELTKNMSAYGYEIVQTLIVDIAPDVQVKKAMNNINAAARMRESVPGATEKDVMDMVLMTQYFDTMKDIGASSKSSALFIPHGPGAVKDVASQFHEGLLQSEIVPRS